MQTTLKILAALVLFIAVSVPAAANTTGKTFSEQELAKLASSYAGAGVVVFTGNADNNTFEVLHSATGVVMGKGFLAGGHIYVDFPRTEYATMIDRLCFKARVQGKWLIVEELLAESFSGMSTTSEVIALPIKSGSPAEGDVPWFRLEKAAKTDEYYLTTTWGLANYSPGAPILELSPVDIGGPGHFPVLLKREDMGDVSLLTFAVRDAAPPARFKRGKERLYTVIYHRLHEQSLGCFESAAYFTLPNGLSAYKKGRTATDPIEIGPDEWWPPLLDDPRPTIPGHPQIAHWRIEGRDIVVTENGSGGTETLRVTMANPEERRSLAGFGGLLLGGFLRGKWVSAQEVVEKDEYGTGIVAFGVYSTKGLEGFGQGGELYQAYPASDTPTFDITMVNCNGTELPPGSAHLALTGPWNAAPRPAVPLNVKNSTYTNRLKEYLAQNGLPNTTPDIMQLFRVDIEGDGVDEVILCAQNIVATGSEGTSWEADKPLGTSIPDGSRKGNYSLILLYKVIDEEVHTIPLAQFIALKDGTPVSPPHVSPQLHKVYQFADLNGDGVMEIVVGENTYESFSYKVFAIKGGRAAQVLAVGAGS